MRFLNTVRPRGESQLVALAFGLALIVGTLSARVVAAQKAPVDSAATKPPEPTRVLWQYGPEGCQFTAVITRDGAVFALDRAGKIHALDAATGNKRWITADKASFSWSYGLALSPDPGFDAVLVGCDAGLFALDCKTGKKLWDTALELGGAGPACTANVVMTGSGDGKVYGCDLQTGDILWQHDYLEDAPADPRGVGGRARFGNRPARPGDAATDGQLVTLAIFDQCRVLALDVVTGKRLWDYQTGGWMHGRPAIGPRNVIVGSQDKHVYAIDKQIGKLSWKVKTRARVEAAAAPTERFAYFGSCDANFYAVDQVVGKIRWQFATDHEEGRGAPIYSCPQVLGDTVYIAAMSGTVYALERNTGKLLWSLRPLANSEINSDLVSDGTRLFLTTRKDGDAGQSAVIAISAK